jgi:hypothetical protein
MYFTYKVACLKQLMPLKRQLEDERLYLRLNLAFQEKTDAFTSWELGMIQK